jgi:arylformamidase
VTWIDASVPVQEGMTTFPGTPAVEVRRVQSIDSGDAANVSRVTLSTHTGTHIDAPLHFLPGAAAADEIDLEAFIGPARVVDVGGGRRIGADELGRHDLRAGERILLRTANTRRQWHRRPFESDYAHVSADGARHAAGRGVRLLGIDHLSIGGEGIDVEETHRTLLGAGVMVLEGLELSAVPEGPCELLCLPLRVAGGDGAPARALIRPGGPA